MKKLLQGREKRLAFIGGAAIPGFMIIILLLAPLWGWQAAYAILKIAAVLFVVVSALWYFADEAREQTEEVEPGGRLAGADTKEPPTYPFEVGKSAAVTPAARENATGVPQHEGGRRASDRDPALPKAAGRMGDEPVPRTYVYRGESGGSEGLKERGFPRKPRLPEDAEILKEYDGWVLYYSISEQAVFIGTTDYHPKPLRLTEEAFADLLDELKARLTNVARGQTY